MFVPCWIKLTKLLDRRSIQVFQCLDTSGDGKRSPFIPSASLAEGGCYWIEYQDDGCGLGCCVYVGDDP